MQLFSLKEALEYFKLSLRTIYPEKEISSITYQIFGHILGLTRLEIHTKTDLQLSKENYEKLKNTIKDLKKYKPIQYIIGEVEFYNLKLNVNHDVLIPRPETEELVDWIIKSNLIKGPAIIDIGTGSGCIALSLVANIPNAKVEGIDKSGKALLIAAKNAERNKLNVQFSKHDIFNSNKLETDKYDIIVSNPPYVLNKEKEIMRQNVLDFEPHLALFVDNDDPLLFYRKISQLALKTLKNYGFVYFEINEKYGYECKNLLLKQGFKNIELKKDINEKWRMIRARKF